MTRLRPDFETALRFLGRASRVLTDKGFKAPVLVGGAAIELYSNNLIATGDFDIATARQEEFEAALVDLGFVRPRGAGMATRGWMHPDFQLGFEVVSSTLLDGLADRDRVRRLDLGDDGTVCVLAIEDRSPTAWANSLPVPRRTCSIRHRCSRRFTMISTRPIWIDVLGKRQPVSLALNTSKPIPLDDFVAEIERRRIAAGSPEMSRNSGDRRTNSKRALLKAIEDAGGTW